MIISRKLARRRMLLSNGKSSFNYYVFKSGDTKIADGLDIVTTGTVNFTNGTMRIDRGEGYVISGVDFTKYNKIYFEYGSATDADNPSSKAGYLGYGDGTNNGLPLEISSFEDYITALNQGVSNIIIQELDISSIKGYKSILVFCSNASGAEIRVKNIWLEGTYDPIIQFNPDEGTGEIKPDNPEPDEPDPTPPSDGEDEDDGGSDEKTSYSITLNLTDVQVTSNSHTDNKVDEGANYHLAFQPKDGYEISSVSVSVGGVPMNDCYDAQYSIIEIFSVNGDIVITITTKAIEIEEPEPEEPEVDTHYLFSSSGNNNFIFGEYHYKPFEGGVSQEASTSWPPAYDEDGLNTSPSQIVLRGKYPSMMVPVGGSSAYLRLQANVVNGSERYFANNNDYLHNGQVYAAKTVGLPFSNYIFHIKASCTGSGYSYVTYNSNSNYKISVSGNENKEYTMNINLVSNAYFDFDSTENGGDFIITDIWLEEIT